MPADIYGFGHRPDIREQRCNYCTCVGGRLMPAKLFTGLGLFVDEDFSLSLAIFHLMVIKKKSQQKM